MKKNTMKKNTMKNHALIAILAVALSVFSATDVQAVSSEYGSYAYDNAELYEVPEADDEMSVPASRILNTDRLALKEMKENENVFVTDTDLNSAYEIEEPKMETPNTFKERVSSAYENLPQPLDIFKPDGYTFDSGIVKNVKIGFLYTGAYSATWPYKKDEVTNVYTNSIALLSMTTKFRDDKTSFKVSYNFLRELDGEKKFFNQVTDFSLTHKFNKAHTLILGQADRLPIGVDGAVGAFAQDLPTRSYIGRTFSNTRSMGVRYKGNYKYANVDIGLYDSSRFMRDLFSQGMDFTGWVNFKPLANLDPDKWGKLTLGTGINTGKSNMPYTVYGAYIGYDYKRFHNKFEYAHADGYNSGKQSGNVAEGFYNTILFDITPKLQLIGRLDHYNTNVRAKNCQATEYTAGLSYRVSKQVKIIGAYTYKAAEKGSDSNAVSVQMRVNI